MNDLQLTCWDVERHHSRTLLRELGKVRHPVEIANQVECGFCHCPDMAERLTKVGAVVG